MEGRVGDPSIPVAYSLPSRTSPKAQPVQTVSSVFDLGLLLNAGFSADDSVARATKKARGMLFYLKRSFAALTPYISSRCAKRLFARILNMQFKHPPPFSPGSARR